MEKTYAAIGQPIDAARVKADARRCVAYYQKRPAVHSPSYADAASALQALRRASVRIGICTDKLQVLVGTVLDHLGVGRYVELVVGSDTTPYRKPHPAPLLHTLAALGVEAQDGLFVGETAIDRDCAAAADMACQIVDRGTGSLVEVAAEARIRCFADLVPV